MDNIPYRKQSPLNHQQNTYWFLNGLISEKYKLPDSYEGYSFHSYETQPLPTDILKPAEILEYRDKSFKKYHLYKPFLNKIEKKFGKKALDNIKDNKKRLYYLRVWLVTEMQPLKKLKNFSKRCWGRSSCYELDHVLPIAHAYLENIPPHLVGSMDNLRFIPKKENRDKSFRLTEDSHKILRKFKRKQDIYKKKNRNGI